MKEKEAINGLLYDELGECRCANCGKLLLNYKKTGKKTQNSVDKNRYSAIIIVKCSRCSAKNRIEF